MADEQACRDALAAEARLGPTVEDEFDPDLGRDGRSKTSDESRRRQWRGAASDCVEQVRAVDE
jgi:hypothetical protein